MAANWTSAIDIYYGRFTRPRSSVPVFSVKDGLAGFPASYLERPVGNYS